MAEIRQVITEINFESWSEFETWLSDFPIPSENTHGANRPLLFRGQRCSSWPLNDSLFRRNDRLSSMKEYYAIATRSRYSLETLSNVRWDFPEWKEIEKVFCDYDEGSLRLDQGLLGYDFLLFLRHNGFPSPLLDWSRSPYVAAFFAFREPSDEIGSHVAIHVLRQEGTQVHSSSESKLLQTGEYVTTHTRHYLQQSDYTICVDFNENESFWSFSSQNELFLRERTSCLVTKVLLPSTIRVSVLKALDRYNLNAYSLFGTPEALSETIAFRQFEVRKASTHPKRPRKWSEI